MKSFCRLILTVTALLMLLVSTNDHYSCKAAASGVVSPLNFNRSNIEVVSIAESDLESEFMMDSEISRMLAAGAVSGNNPYNSLKPRPTYNCGRGQRYCLPGKNPDSLKEKCDAYKRNCRPQ